MTSLPPDGPTGVVPTWEEVARTHGRFLYTVAYRLAGNVELRGGVWVERSDRDDPRWDVPAPGTLATHAGVDLGAALRFGS